MTLLIKHAFASAKADGGDPTVVRPSNWNDGHVITMAAGKVMGRDTSGAGNAQELALAFSAAGDPDFDAATGHLGVPTGTTGQRIGGARTGVLRYNTTLSVFEGFFAAAWGSLLAALSPAILGTATLVNATFTGLLTLLSLAETYTAPAITAGTLTIDLTLGTVFNVSNIADITTFSIINTTAAHAESFTIFFTADGTQRAQTWGASVKWPGGNPPALSSAVGKVDCVSFVTNNGGTTWFGFVGGYSFS